MEASADGDGSPGRGGGMLAARRDPGPGVIRAPATVGPGPARDLGAKEATGEYVWFVDGDDELAEGALGAGAGPLAGPRPGVVVVDFLHLYPDGRTCPGGGAEYRKGPAARARAGVTAPRQPTLTV